MEFNFEEEAFIGGGISFLRNADSIGQCVYSKIRRGYKDLGGSLDGSFLVWLLSLRCYEMVLFLLLLFQASGSREF